MGKASRRKRDIRAKARHPSGMEQRDVRIVIKGEGGEGMDALSGLLVDPDTDKIMGVVPGSPAAKLTRQEITALTDYEWEFPEGDQPLTYSFAPDATGDLHMEHLPAARELTLPTPTLVNLSRLARKQAWCSKALPEITERDLDPRGKHLIINAWKHTTEDWKRENVRCHMYLKMRGTDEPEDRVVDLPSRQFGILLQTLRPSPVVRREIESMLAVQGVPEQPLWAAGRSFPKAWREVERIARLHILWEVHGDEMVTALRLGDPGLDGETARALANKAESARASLCGHTLRVMEMAKLIVAEPEWVEGIDDKRPDTEMLMQFASDAQLPFDAIYLDCEGPAANLVTFPVRAGARKTRTAHLAGALLARDEFDRLVITPMADLPHIPGEENYSPYEPLGQVVLGAEPPQDITYAPVEVDGLRSRGQAVVLRARQYDPDAGATVVLSPDMVELPDEAYAAWGLIVYAAAMRALRVMFMLLGATNVELVEAKLTGEARRRVKRADKRGWPIEIGMQVAVRWQKKLYLKPPDAERADAEKMDYSHAHWRSGHPNYYPLGTRIADALAEREPDSPKLVNHPVKGLCRVVWHPPVIVGRRDRNGNEREPVDKVRRVVGELPPAYDVSDKENELDAA